MRWVVFKTDFKRRVVSGAVIIIFCQNIAAAGPVVTRPA